jgi:hypothetical protein
MALLKAVARAHRWRQMLLDGEMTSINAPIWTGGTWAEHSISLS